MHCNKKKEGAYGVEMLKLQCLLERHCKQKTTAIHLGTEASPEVKEEKRNERDL